LTTPINIVSLDQGKNIYKDWTLEVVDDTPSDWQSIIEMLADLWARKPKLPAASGAGAQTMVPGE
jgi:hypothetical protein